MNIKLHVLACEKQGHIGKILCIKIELNGLFWNFKIPVPKGLQLLCLFPSPDCQYITDILHPPHNSSIILLYSVYQ